MSYIPPYTQRNNFEILLNQSEIWLYLPYSDWFGTASGRCPCAVPNQSDNGKYNLISVWFIKISKVFLCVSRPSSLDWKKYISCPKGSPLCIMGSIWGPTLKPRDTIYCRDARGVSWGPELIPHDAERRQFLEQLYTWPLYFFSGLSLFPYQ